LGKKQHKRLPKYPIKNKNNHFPSKYYLLESESWNSLTISAQKVLLNLYSRLQWINMGSKTRPEWEIKNNGKIELSEKKTVT